MATTSNTELRCLSDADLNTVSGGNPLLAGAAGFFLAWAGTKLLDAPSLLRAQEERVPRVPLVQSGPDQGLSEMLAGSGGPEYFARMRHWPCMIGGDRINGPVA